MLLKNLAIISATVASLFITGTSAAFAKTIGECPAVAASSTVPTNVNNLRPGDIKITAALGDSIMAGFAAKGITGGSILSIQSLFEHRGVSYGAGGDNGAVTIPNFIKKYNSKVRGASKGSHLAELCYGPLCPPFQYRPLKDVLNAAQSGGMAMNLDYELDYLIPTMKLLPGASFKNDWKLINVQIGSNDQCASCIDELIPMLRPELYGKHLEAAVERIRQKIPKVLVNLIGTFNVSEVYSVTTGQDYCSAFKPSDFHINTVECPCALYEPYRPKMDQMSMGYNRELERIYNKYKPLQTATFGVMYTPANIDIASFPVQGLSNVDCFHPGLHGHEFVAKVLWNTLFTPLSQKQSEIKWNSSVGVYCPIEADRFNLD
ncbi:hypothetical protein BDB01DRAFT_768090 [Pilobolus umbonatus]|nr:hypothetical protein BDB01DRAFT_768090 [Pilobolus umbonatus]